MARFFKVNLFFILFSLMCLLFFGCIEEEEGRLFQMAYKYYKERTADLSGANVNMPQLSEYDSTVPMHRSLIDTLINRPQKIWAHSNYLHYFSDTFYKDNFFFEVKGDKDFTAKAFITIKNHNNKQIYADTFELLKLLAIGLEGDGYFATTTKQEAFAQKYADELFNEQHFNPIHQLIVVNDTTEISTMAYEFTYQIDVNTYVKITCDRQSGKIFKVNYP